MTSSIIEEDLTIEGNIKSSDGSVEVRGKLIGDLSAQSVVVQAGGLVDGAVSAKNVSVEGKHTGKLDCDDLKLASTSEIQADVTARTMTTESGAKIAGTVKISGA